MQLRSLKQPRGGGITKFDHALASTAGALWNGRREGAEGNFQQVGGGTESTEGWAGRDAFGEAYKPPMSYEEGIAPSAETQAKAAKDAAWAPPF